MRALPLGLALLALLPQCGGSGGADPKTASDENLGEARAADDDGSRASGDSPADEGDVAESKPSGPSCDDGTCSVCGSGICPAGWFCDESAPGGAACSWLKECAEKSSCACVTKVLGASCKCRDEGGVKVSCN